VEAEEVERENERERKKPSKLDDNNYNKYRYFLSKIRGKINLGNLINII
jgi:hypothetical protein